MKSVTIIIPVIQNQKHIHPFLMRIVKRMIANKRNYEVILIEESGSNSFPDMKLYTNTSPLVRHFMKQGKKGITQSLLEGFSYAKNDIFISIADIKEYIPNFIERIIEDIEGGSDIKFVKKNYGNTNFINNNPTKAITYLCMNLLYKVKYDTQSGIVGFKKEVLERITLPAYNLSVFNINLQ